jgi:hypothetical protein
MHGPDSVQNAHTHTPTFDRSHLIHGPKNVQNVPRTSKISLTKRVHAFIRAHSIGVLLVRSLDIPVQFRGQLKWQGVLQIHPGPSHGGKNVHVLVQLIVDELKVRDRAIAIVCIHSIDMLMG